MPLVATCTCHFHRDTNSRPFFMSIVRQGVVLQRSSYCLAVSHGICCGDDRLLLPHLRVFLQSEVSFCVWWDRLFPDLPSLRIYLHPRGGWERERVRQRENGRQSSFHLRVRTGSEVFCHLRRRGSRSTMVQSGQESRMYMFLLYL